MLFNSKSGGGQRSKWIFLPRRHPGGYKGHEKVLTLLIIKEIKIKTTRPSHLTQLRVAYLLRFTNKMAEDVETWEVSYNDAGNVSC